MKRFSQIAVSAATLAVLSSGYPVPSGPVHAAPGEVPGPEAAPDSVTTPDTAVPAAGQTRTPSVPSVVLPTMPQAPAPTPPPNAIREKEAVAKVRALFDGLGELPYATAHYLPGDPQAGILDDIGSKPTWDLTFFATDPSKFQGPPSEPPDTLHARVDAITGAILEFSRMNPAWTGDRQPDNQLALQAATAFLQKVGSPFRDQGLERIGGGQITQAATPGTKTLQWRFAVVTFSEKVNGIPFPQNSVDIRVDQSGHVVGMEIMHPFDSSQLPNPSRAISPAEAQQRIAAQLQLEKMYLTMPFHLDSSGQLQKGDRPVLGYFPVRQGSIDALSGKPFTGGFSTNAEIDKTLSITGQGQALQAKDKDAAARLVADFLHMDLSGMTLQEQTPPPDTLIGFRARVLTWTLRPPAGPPAAQASAVALAEQPSHINAVFDADTGQWLNLNVDTQMLRGKPVVLSLEQGEAKALSFLQQILPKGSQAVQLVWELDGTKPLADPPDWFDPAKGSDFMPEPLPVYTYTFRPLVQGVPVLDRIYNVQVDATTGRIVEFILTPASSPALPDNRNTITPEQAKTAFLQARPLRLAYTWPVFGNQAAPQGQLVYEFDPNHSIQYIDAFTGKPTFFGGR